MFALAVAFFVSCEKDDSARPQETTYSIIVSGIQVPEGMTVEILAIEYNSSNERLQTNRFNLVSVPMNKNYTANSRTEKIKVAMNLYGTSSGQSASLWVQQVFYLSKGKHTNINITGSSPTGQYEP